MGEITMLFSMFHTLGVFTTILSIAGVSVAMVVNRDFALDRKGMSAKCSGTPQELILNPGQDIVLRNEGFETGEFIEGCSTLYEVLVDRDDQDLGQWRIKVVMEEMNLPCSSVLLMLGSHPVPSYDTRAISSDYFITKLFLINVSK